MKILSPLTGNTYRTDEQGRRLIHVTDRRSFRDCKRKYRYSNIDRITPASGEDRIDAMWIGTGGHFALERYYRAMKEGIYLDADSVVALWDLYKAEHMHEKQELPEETDIMMQKVLRGYVNKYQEEDFNYHIVEVEARYYLPVIVNEGTEDEEEVILALTVDVMLRDKRNGTLWIMDHKFLASLPNAKHLELDDQMTCYIWALRRLGIEVQGAIYNGIKKKAPVEPEPLVKGGLSKNMKQDTTYDLYMEAIFNNNLNPEDYTEILNHLKTKPDAFFQRDRLIRSRRELENFNQDFMDELEDICSVKTKYYPSPGIQCGWCQFQTLCKSEREGSDVKLLLNTFFREKDHEER